MRVIDVEWAIRGGNGCRGRICEDNFWQLSGGSTLPMEGVTRGQKYKSSSVRGRPTIIAKQRCERSTQGDNTDRANVRMQKWNKNQMWERKNDSELCVWQCTVGGRSGSVPLENGKPCDLKSNRHSDSDRSRAVKLGRGSTQLAGPPGAVRRKYTRNGHGPAGRMCTCH